MQPHPWRYRWMDGWIYRQIDRYILFVVLLVSHKKSNSVVFYDRILFIKIKCIPDKSRCRLNQVLMGIESFT